MIQSQKQALLAVERLLLQEFELLQQYTGLLAVDHVDEASAVAAEFYLCRTDEGISLFDLLRPKQGPVVCDFSEAAFARRYSHGRLAHEMLIKAMGRHDAPLYIVDACFGLGRDAFLLAAAGHQLLGFERSVLACVLAMDGLQRAAGQPELEAISGRVELLHEDFITQATAAEFDLKPDIVYLDPMFPERKKSALVKKEMRVFQRLIGADHDVDRLLDTALTVAQKRVVLKRPLKSAAVKGPKPAFTQSGRSSRFDVYLC